MYLESLGMFLAQALALQKMAAQAVNWQQNKWTIIFTILFSIFLFVSNSKLKTYDLGVENLGLDHFPVATWTTPTIWRAEI